jgi:uncharacterized membrane protein YphA (DoxX/SURF4 family)
MSVGIPPFLTLSQKPSALRDKSGLFKIRTDFASLQNFVIGIRSPSSHDPSMKIATIIARVLLGLIFVVFGSNIFLHFIPMPPPSPGLLGDFTKALFLSHYLHIVAVFQIIGGLLLLIGRFVPLGLLLLAPVIVNIDLVHILMDPSGLPMAAVISILLVFLIWRYRDAFAGILRP